jgi:hypothetical protein
MLRRRGISISPNTVGRLLIEKKYSLHTNRKQKAHVQDPDRDEQFRYLIRRRSWYLSRNIPVISVDSKKKEWIGNFKNPGQTWRKAARQVFDHDYPSWAEGVAIPYGIFDVGQNSGYIVIGVSHDTAEFALAAIRRWWKIQGHRRYGHSTRILIQADGGGSNSSRRWGWKVALQKFADEFGLILTVNHYPPGASKWNLIEHRMFSLISKNWAGEPLVSYETVLKFIRTTRSKMGFRCRAVLDKKIYPRGIKVTKEQRSRVLLDRHKILPKWNYTIRPHRFKSK